MPLRRPTASPNNSSNGNGNGGGYWDVEDEASRDFEPLPLGGSGGGQRSARATASSLNSTMHRTQGQEHYVTSTLLGESDVGGASGGVDGAAESFKVFIRVRPPLNRELNGYRNFVDVVQLSRDAPGAITLCDAVETEEQLDGSGGGGGGTVVYARQTFGFDHVYAPRATQAEVYNRSARPAVLSVMDGYNATLMAYGQTGTGKTYTMEGFTNDEQRGIIPRCVEEIFDCICASRGDGQTKFLVRASYMQIYNEVISDLLAPPAGGGGGGGVAASGRSMSVRHTPQRGVFIDGLSEWIVRSPRDVYGLIERGTACRATSATRMSELSSRSHAIFTIVVEVLEGDEEAPISYRFGKLNIVDLAGSEKVRQSGVTGQRMEETKNINRSLHELGNVISALASKATGSSAGRARHIPFRNSVLTSALRDSLGGNCKTTLIACISPALESYTESLSTLMFANRAKNIRTTAVVNEDMDQAMLLRKYERELTRLRELLQQQQQQQQQQNLLGSRDGAPDASFMSQLEEGRQRAEEDREAALAALEASSQTCVQLERRIHELETMMNEGGFSGGPRTSEEYSQRLQELDRERLVMEEDKAQVTRYKQLLLKQRDIMLNLTTRLNERDETILQLQEEIDAYDAHVGVLEGQIEELLEAGAGGKRGASPPSPLSSQLRLTEAEAAKLSALVARRAEEGLPPAAAARMEALEAERDALAVRVAASDGLVALYASALAAGGSPRVRMDSAQRDMEVQVRALVDAQRDAREERRRLARDLERVRFELDQQLEAAQVTPAQKAAVSRLWQAVQALEAEIAPAPRTEADTPAAAKAAVTAARATLSNALDGAIGAREEAWRRILAEKQQAIDELAAAAAAATGTAANGSSGQDHAGCKEEMSGLVAALAAKNVEMAALAKELHVQKKDRRAIQTILEQRMKGKVERICELLSRLEAPPSSSGASSDAAARSNTAKAVAEAQSLQSLLNASIAAMES